MLYLNKKINQYIFEEDNDWVEEVSEEQNEQEQTSSDLWNDSDSPFEVEQPDANAQQQVFNNPNQQAQAAAAAAAQQQNYMQQQAYIMQQQQMQAQQIARQQAYQEAVKRATTETNLQKAAPMSKKNKIIIGSSVAGGVVLLAILGGSLPAIINSSKNKNVIKTVDNEFVKKLVDVQQYIDSIKNNPKKIYDLKYLETLENVLTKVKEEKINLEKNTKPALKYKNDVSSLINKLSNQQKQTSDYIRTLDNEYEKFQKIQAEYDNKLQNMKSPDIDALYGENEVYDFFTGLVGKQGSLYEKINREESSFSKARKAFTKSLEIDDAKKVVEKLISDWGNRLAGWVKELDDLKTFYYDLMTIRKDLRNKMNKANSTPEEKEQAKQALVELAKFLLVDENGNKNENREVINYDEWLSNPPTLTTKNKAYYTNIINISGIQLKIIRQAINDLVTPQMNKLNGLKQEINANRHFQILMDDVQKAVAEFTPRTTQIGSFKNREEVEEFANQIKHKYETLDRLFKNSVERFNFISELNALVETYLTKVDTSNNVKDLYDRARQKHIDLQQNGVTDTDLKKYYLPFGFIKYYKDHQAALSNDAFLVYNIIKKQEDINKNITGATSPIRYTLEELDNIYNEFLESFKQTIKEIVEIEIKRTEAKNEIQKADNWNNGNLDAAPYKYSAFKKEIEEEFLNKDTKIVGEFYDYRDYKNNFSTLNGVINFYKEALKDNGTDPHKNFKIRLIQFRKYVDEAIKVRDWIGGFTSLKPEEANKNPFKNFDSQKTLLRNEVSVFLTNETNWTFKIFKEKFGNDANSLKSRKEKINEQYNILSNGFNDLKNKIAESETLISNLTNNGFTYLGNELSLAKNEANLAYNSNALTLEAAYYKNALNKLQQAIEKNNQDKLVYDQLKVKMENKKVEAENLWTANNSIVWLENEEAKLAEAYTNWLVNKFDPIKKLDLQEATNEANKFIDSLSSLMNIITNRKEVHTSLEKGINNAKTLLHNPDPDKRVKWTNEGTPTHYTQIGKRYEEYITEAQNNLNVKDVTTETWQNYINGLLTKKNKHDEEYTELFNLVQEFNKLVADYTNTLNATKTNSTSIKFGNQSSQSYDLKSELYDIIRDDEKNILDNSKTNFNVLTKTIQEYQNIKNDLQNKFNNLLTDQGLLYKHYDAITQYNEVIKKYNNLFIDNNTKGIEKDLLEELELKLGNKPEQVKNGLFSDIERSAQANKNNVAFSSNKNTRTNEYISKKQTIQSLDINNRIQERKEIYTNLLKVHKQTKTFNKELLNKSWAEEANSKYNKVWKSIQKNRQNRMKHLSTVFAEYFTSATNDNYNQSNQISGYFTEQFSQSEDEKKDFILNNMFEYAKSIFDEYDTISNWIKEAKKNVEETGQDLAKAYSDIEQVKNIFDGHYVSNYDKTVKPLYDLLSVSSYKEDNFFEEFLSSKTNLNDDLNNFQDLKMKAIQFKDLEKTELWLKSALKWLWREYAEKEILTTVIEEEIKHEFYNDNNSKIKELFSKSLISKNIFTTIREKLNNFKYLRNAQYVLGGTNINIEGISLKDLKINDIYKELKDIYKNKYNAKLFNGQDSSGIGIQKFREIIYAQSATYSYQDKLLDNSGQYYNSGSIYKYYINPNKNNNNKYDFQVENGLLDNFGSTLNYVEQNFDTEIKKEAKELFKKYNNNLNYLNNGNSSSILTNDISTVTFVNLLKVLNTLKSEKQSLKSEKDSVTQKVNKIMNDKINENIKKQISKALNEYMKAKNINIQNNTTGIWYEEYRSNLKSFIDKFTQEANQHNSGLNFTKETSEFFTEIYGIKQYGKVFQTMLEIIEQIKNFNLLNEAHNNFNGIIQTLKKDYLEQLKAVQTNLDATVGNDTNLKDDIDNKLLELENKEKEFINILNTANKFDGINLLQGNKNQTDIINKYIKKIQEWNTTFVTKMINNINTFNWGNKKWDNNNVTNSVDDFKKKVEEINKLISNNSKWEDILKKVLDKVFNNDIYLNADKNKWSYINPNNHLNAKEWLKNISETISELNEVKNETAKLHNNGKLDSGKINLYLEKSNKAINYFDNVNNRYTKIFDSLVSFVNFFNKDLLDFSSRVKLGSHFIEEKFFTNDFNANDISYDYDLTKNLKVSGKNELVFNDVTFDVLNLNKNNEYASINYQLKFKFSATEEITYNDQKMINHKFLNFDENKLNSTSSYSFLNSLYNEDQDAIKNKSLNSNIDYSINNLNQVNEETNKYDITSLIYSEYRHFFNNGINDFKYKLRFNNSNYSLTKNSVLGNKIEFNTLNNQTFTVDTLGTKIDKSIKFRFESFINKYHRRFLELFGLLSFIEKEKIDIKTNNNYSLIHSSEFKDLMFLFRWYFFAVNHNTRKVVDSWLLDKITRIFNKNVYFETNVLNVVEEVIKNSSILDEMLAKLNNKKFMKFSIQNIVNSGDNSQRIKTEISYENLFNSTVLDQKDSYILAYKNMSLPSWATDKTNYDKLMNKTLIYKELNSNISTNQSMINEYNSLLNYKNDMYHHTIANSIKEKPYDIDLKDNTELNVRNSYISNLNIVSNQTNSKFNFEIVNSYIEKLTIDENTAQRLKSMKFINSFIGKIEIKGSNTTLNYIDKLEINNSLIKDKNSLYALLKSINNATKATSNSTALHLLNMYQWIDFSQFMNTYNYNYYNEQNRVKLGYTEVNNNFNFIPKINNNNLGNIGQRNENNVVNNFNEFIVKNTTISNTEYIKYANGKIINKNYDASNELLYQEKFMNFLLTNNFNNLDIKKYVQGNRYFNKYAYAYFKTLKYKYKNSKLGKWEHKQYNYLDTKDERDIFNNYSGYLHTYPDNVSDMGYTESAVTKQKLNYNLIAAQVNKLLFDNVYIKDTKDNNILSYLKNQNTKLNIDGKGTLVTKNGNEWTSKDKSPMPGSPYRTYPTDPLLANYLVNKSAINKTGDELFNFNRITEINNFYNLFFYMNDQLTFNEFKIENSFISGEDNSQIKYRSNDLQQEHSVDWKNNNNFTEF